MRRRNSLPLAGCDLRDQQATRWRRCQAQQGSAVVVDPPAWNHGPQRSVELCHLKAGDVFEQMKCMRADVADAPPGPFCAGSDRHAACFWPVVSIGLLSQPCKYSTATLRILPSRRSAQIARASRTSGITRIGVRQPVGQSRLGNGLLEHCSLGVGGSGRLVAHHRKACLQGRFGDGKMKMIGRDDRDKVDGIRPFRSASIISS